MKTRGENQSRGFRWEGLSVDRGMFDVAGGVVVPISCIASPELHILPDLLDLPKAKIRRARPAWLLWLIPLGAAALCVWFLYRDFIATGPKITIYFQNAEGLDPGNTAVKYRGAEVGIIKSLALTPDHQHVKVTAEWRQWRRPRRDGCGSDRRRYCESGSCAC